MAGGHRGEEFREVKRRILRPTHVLGHAGHVAILRPPTEVSVLVVAIRVQAAGADHNVDPRVEHGGVNGVVPTQRVAHRTISPMLHVRKAVEHIQSSYIVPDRLHSAAVVPQPLEIRGVSGQVWIAGRDGDKATSREFAGVLAVGLASQTHDYTITHLVVGRVQT